MSPDIPGLVQTSTNLGVLDTADGTVSFYMLHRSSIDASKMAVVDRVTAHCALAGFEATHIGGYPGWKPEPGSDLVKLVNGVHQEVFGAEMKIVAIHAGLECGIIGEKYPGMQMVSIGPDMWDVHTPDEHLSIPSVAKFWKFLLAVLAK
jgi:dipeptidase D